MENEILNKELPEEGNMPELNMEEINTSASDVEEVTSILENIPEQMPSGEIEQELAEIPEEELSRLLPEIPEDVMAETPKKTAKYRDQQEENPELKTVKAVLTTVVSMLSVILTAVLMVTLLMGTGVPATSAADAADEAIMDRYDMYMTNQVSNALDGVLSIEKVYWLNDDDLIAPEPNPANYGSTNDPTTLQWLLDDARELLNIEDEFVFNTNIQLEPGTQVRYYLDETIFAITWREVRNRCIYTFAEVKIAHASQFRRFLAGGTYGSDKQFITTQMASDVNAVVASSGDFYKFRNYGTIVYDGVVKRINSYAVDTLFIDDKGDMIMVPRGEMTDINEAQKFVDENNIRFSIAFGPILIQDGKRVETGRYPIGEIYDTYPRAGLGQMGELHYTVVVANGRSGYYNLPDIISFADVMESIGCIQAYTLDGGQTGVIAMDGDMINPVQYGSQRQISDIFYFATALPDGE